MCFSCCLGNTWVLQRSPDIVSQGKEEANDNSNNDDHPGFLDSFLCSFKHYLMEQSTIMVIVIAMVIDSSCFFQFCCCFLHPKCPSHVFGQPPATVEGVQVPAVLLMNEPR